MTETYFDFDSETFQITQRKRLSESSGYGSSTPGVSSPHMKCHSSEDTGFETSSEHSFMSHDDIPAESPQNVSPRTTPGQEGFHWPVYPRSSFDSLTFQPLKRHDSRDSIRSSSSFWDSNFSPETKQVLSKIRDQMRLSLVRVRELEEQVKEIPLLQVKISILQEEKRQLASQLQHKSNLKKVRSYSGNISRQTSSSSNDDFVFHPELGKPISVGVGDYSVNDILCEKCKEIQNKLLRSHDHLSVNNPSLSALGLHSGLSSTLAKQESDVIKVYQNRCTQTKVTEHKDDCSQTADGLKEGFPDIAADESLHDARQPTTDCNTPAVHDRARDAIPKETRSIGVGQMGSFVKDAYVGEDKELLTVRDTGVQKVINSKDQSCSVKAETENIGITVGPTLISVGTGSCRLERPLPDATPSYRTVASQTIQSTSLVSVGVGVFSVDEFQDYECCKPSHVSVEEILESNKYILNTVSVSVGTCPWPELEKKTLREHRAAKSTSTVAVSASLSTRTVGCGDHSITDIDCQNCVSKSFRSLGIDCTPLVSEVAVGEEMRSPRQDPEVAVGQEIPLNDQTVFIPKKLDFSSVGVGECCISDNYCDRCFSLHTRTVGVGNGSICDDFVNLKDQNVRNVSSVGDLRNGKTTVDGGCPQQSCSKNFEGNHMQKDSTVVERMFSDEYERIAEDWIPDYGDDNLKHISSLGDDILLTCQLLQRHFQNEGILDENNLLVCMKNIEDYWFNCVTDSRLGKEFISKLLKLFKQNLPLLLDGLINSQDENGNTAMHYLVTYGKFDCVNEILKADMCDLNITNKAGYSSVMLGSLKEVVDKKDKVVLKRLFEKGNLNCVAKSTGQTALMLAAGSGKIEIVDLLLQCGAAESINTTDLDGSTALMCACEHGYSAIVKRLLAVDGCDATIEDQSGMTRQVA